MSNCVKFIEILFVLSALIFYAFLFPVFSMSAALPDVPNAVETRLYQGKPAEIKAFIKQQKQLIASLMKQAKQDLSNAENPADKNAVSKALDVFTELSFQFNRILSELKMPRTVNISPPAMGTPPYSYGIFLKIRDFQEKIKQQIKDNTNEIHSIKRKITTIESNLKSMVFVYAGIEKKTLPGKLTAYGKLAEIYSLQTEYARLNLKMSRLSEYGEALYKLQAKGAELAEICIKHLKITPEDIDKAKKAYDQAKAKEQAFLEDLQRDSKILNSRAIRYELQLENIAEKASAMARNSSLNLLQIERQRIKIIIETIQIRLKRMEQKKINLQISSLNALFKYDRLNQYAGGATKRPLVQVINTWKTKRVFLDKTNSFINKIASWTYLEQSRLTEKLILASSEKETVLTHSGNKQANINRRKIRSSLSSLERQILKAKQLADDLILTIADTKNDISVLSDDINWFLDSLGNEMPWYMNIKIYFEKNLSSTWEEARSIFFYPLFSAGDINITLAFIVKFLFLLIAGFIILKLIRKKSYTFLREKTKLSPGTINSITTLGYYILLVFAGLIILTSVGVDLSQITVLVGALGVGIGFGLQTIANNFISGIILLTEQSVKTGDIIKLENGLTGEVQKIAIRATIVRTIDGNEVIVPNSEFVSGRVNSWTYSDNWRRLKIPFGVSYDSDPDEIAKIAMDAAREVHSTIENRTHPINVRFTGFGDNSLNFTLRVWCRLTYLRGEQGLLSDYYFALFRKFKDAGVDIPFPQNVLHVQSISKEVLDKIKEYFAEQISESNNNISSDNNDNNMITT